MKTKHVSPLRLIALFFLLSGYSLFYLAKTLTFGAEHLGALEIAAMCCAIFFMVVSIVLNGFIIRNKQLKQGDEFTTAVMNKAGRFCFQIIISLVTLLFVALQIFMKIHNSYEDKLNDLLDVRLILSIIAGIQIITTFLFSLLIFIFSKKGNFNGI